MNKRDPFARLEPLVQRVYGYVAYRVGEGPEAEALTKATFDRALRHRAAFDPRTEEPAPWLIAIARAVLVERQLHEVEGVINGPAPRDPLTHGPVGMLDESERDLIALRYGADLTVEQISEIVGREQPVVEVALSQALTTLHAHTTSLM